MNKTTITKRHELQPDDTSCDHCGHVFPVLGARVEQRPTPLEGVVSVGIVCPECGDFFAGAFYNKSLIAERRTLQLTRHPKEQAKLLRQFKRRFTAMQKACEIALIAQLSKGSGSETDVMEME